MTPPATARITLHEAYSSGLTRFQDDDSGFADWLSGHPGGYFINADRGSRPRYLKLHRTGCPHVNAEPGVHWTKDYIKICAGSRAELEDWAEGTVEAELTPCRTCVRD